MPGNPVTRRGKNYVAALPKAPRREAEPVAGTDFEHYSNAYRVGYLGRVKYDGRSYHDIEDELAADYAREEPDLSWQDARAAARAAWDRADRRAQELRRN